MVLSALGKQEEALQEVQKARDVQSKLFKNHPKMQVYLLDLSRTCLKRGSILAQMNKFDKSVNDLDEGIALADRLLRDDPRHPQVLSYLVTGLRERAKVQTRLARYRDAEADWNRASQ